MAKYLVIALFLLFSDVRGDGACLKYDFENGFDHFSNVGTLCENFPAWTVGTYSTMGIDSPNPDSNSFIYTGPVLSCSSSFTIQFFTGVVEVNIYKDSAAGLDQFTVILMKKVEGGTDAAVSTTVVSEPNGWHRVSLDIPSSLGAFEGYISFLGLAGEDSVILIDSFRYMPSFVNEEHCLIYETVVETTDAPVVIAEEKCVTYNFEDNFDVQFSHNNYLCDGFLTWSLEHYTAHNLASPNDESESFIAPTEYSSCIASDTFVMSPLGLIEANVYMQPATYLDHIIILAQQVRDNDVDAVVGFNMYHPSNYDFVDGWNVLNFTVNTLDSFNGYIILFGSAKEGSVVLVDSVRYIPPTSSPSDEECSFY